MAVTSVADFRRLPYGTVLRLINNAAGPVDPARARRMIMSYRYDKRQLVMRNDLKEYSYAAVEGVDVHPTAKGFMVTRRGKLLAEYEYVVQPVQLTQQELVYP